MSLDPGDILVIGRTGQVAEALAEASGGRTRHLGRDALDLADTPAIAPAILAHPARLVVNAAAYTAVDKAEQEREAADLVNAVAPGEIAAAAAAMGAGLLHLSTDYVYPGDREGPHREDDPTGPINAYGTGKLAGEMAAVAANPRTIVLRTSWVYGPRGRNFVLTMLRLADRDRLTIVADQKGQPTSALDLAEAILAIAPRLVAAPEGDPAWGVFHYAGEPATTWADFAEAIFARAGGRLIAARPEIARIPTSEYPTPARRPLNSTLDCSKFKAVFGRPMADWPASLDRVLDRISADRRGSPR